MNKLFLFYGILTIVVVIVIVIAFNGIETKHTGVISIPPTHIIKPNITAINTTSITNTTIPSSNTIKANVTNETNTIKIIKSCPSQNTTVPIYNGNFSTGTYAGWNETNPGFWNAPFNLIEANKEGDYYGAQWSGYNGTYVASSFDGGLARAPGNLTSNSFKVTEPFLNFKIISDQNNLLYVEILENGKPNIIAHYNTYATNNTNAATTFENASIPMSTLICKNVSIKIVAGVVGSGIEEKYNYIMVGDFYLSMYPDETPGIIVGSYNIS